MNTMPFLFRVVLLSCLLLAQAAWAAQGDNIALGKTATQSSNYGGGYEADKANNGNLTDTSITNATLNAWWQVDLGAAAPVDKVTVYHRPGYTDQGQNIYILASPNPIPAALADALADPNVIQVAHVGAYTTSTSHSLNNAQVRYVKVQHDNSNYLSLAEVQVIEGASPDAIAGAAFRDANGNGSRDAGEQGVAGVTVTAYAADGSQAATAVTDANGGYRLAGLTVDANYRVEFTPGTPQGGCNAVSIDDFPTLNGGVYGSSVQFVKSGTAANFGLFNPVTYNTGSANTSVFSAIQYNGDPLAGGDSTAQNWFVGFPYTSSGKTAPPQKLAGDKIGSAWGVAYSKQANRLFTTAYIKRHVGLGPMGSGGIYMLEPTASSFNVTSFFDMDGNSFNTAANPTRTRADSTAPAYGAGASFTINGNPGTSLTYLGDTDPLTGQPVGLGVVGTNVERGLPAASGTPNYDPAAYAQTGKVGLGDIDISDDGKYLFVTNLYQRKIFRLTLDNANNPTAITAVSAYALPDVTVTKGVLRPFGLKYRAGKLYVGAVTTGENAGNNTVNGATDLYAHVFTLNEATGNAVFSDTTALSFPLNYQKGSGGAGITVSNWVPWSDTVTYTTFFSAPSPLLSDLEFTPAGDMVLAFLDRTGNQYGLYNYNYLSSSTAVVPYAVGGDVLIAGWDCQNTKFTLENKGTYVSADGKTYNGAANNQGPGGGEFFSGEEYSAGHFETSEGAVALLPGAGELYLNLMDPLTVCAGGTGRLSLSTGTTISSSRYQLYGDGSCAVASGLGKANGMGDLELMTPPPPTEIGNRVWLDTDGDGIQDAGEPGIGYVQVKLLAADGITVLAAATTASDGTYYFSNASGTSTASAIYNITALQPGTAYTVQFPETLRVGEVQYHLTAAVAGSNRLIDSNASSIGFAPITNIDIPMAGANNHSFDVGYTAAAPKTCTTVSNTVTVSKLTGTTDPTTSNNSAAWDVQVNCVAQKIDLKLRKVADKTTVRHGETLTYTITAENESDVDATGVQVRDDLPMQMTLVKATPSQGTFANGVWEVGSIKARQTATLTLEVKVE